MSLFLIKTFILNIILLMHVLVVAVKQLLLLIFYWQLYLYCCGGCCCSCYYPFWSNVWQCQIEFLVAHLSRYYAWFQQFNGKRINLSTLFPTPRTLDYCAKDDDKSADHRMVMEVNHILKGLREESLTYPFRITFTLH